MTARRRSATTRRPLTRQTAAAVLLIAALATGRAVQDLMPAEQDAARAFERHGGVGEPLELRWGTVEVGAVEGSTRISADGQVRVTSGVYLVVPITFTAAVEPRAIAYVAVRDTSGRVFDTSVERNPFTSGGNAQPGIPRRMTAAVELPADAVAGAELVVALPSNDEDHRHDDVAVVDLGLTAADAQAWAAVEDELPVDEPVDAAAGDPADRPEAAS
ncbi:hypothetical protein [Jiangella asiatica]|uniref:DUF4352 domain-containing protein n=1 Tax=Jiangella asiatica TaxID=2530372 RepID=A0A4R5CTK2_9ACTN|nr:hypothetical protein [Jiangella asiatica]TDE01043.1 hypothetical protein E1269_23965 [Jiangella asiatica]